MATLAFPYAKPWIPHIDIALHAGTRSGWSSFTVDSGAIRSCLPLWFVTAVLGIEQDDLTPVLGGATLADGSAVAAWTTPDLVRCEILLSDRTLSGASFFMDPFVIDEGDFLLGQMDFFFAFGVRFDRDGIDQFVELTY